MVHQDHVGWSIKTLFHPLSYPARDEGALARYEAP